jgi:hypothetical protein
MVDEIEIVAANLNISRGFCVEVLSEKRVCLSRIDSLST